MVTPDASDEVLYSVDVSFTIADHYAVVFSAGYQFLIRIFAPLAALAFIFILLGILLSGESIREALARFPWELWSLLAFALALLNFGILPLLAWFTSRRRQGGEPFRISIEQDGVRVVSRNGTGLVYWAAIRRIRATNRRLLLFIGSASAIIIPARAMRDDRSFQSLVDTALARCRETRKLA